MYESCSDDHACAQVSGEEVGLEGGTEVWDSLCDHGEECRKAGNNQYDEEGRYSCSQLTVVFVVGRIESADDLMMLLIVSLPFGYQVWKSLDIFRGVNPWDMYPEMG